MSRGALTLILIVLAAVTGMVACNTQSTQAPAQARASIAAVPGQKGGQDATGPYEVVADWPKPLSQLPGHEKWTYSAVQSIFAESPDRVFLFMRGEIPKLERPREVPYP